MDRYSIIHEDYNMKEEMKIGLRNTIDNEIKNSILEIPSLVQKHIRQIVITEICRQLNLRYSFNEFKPDYSCQESSPLYIEIRDTIKDQFREAIQKNINELLTNRDMNQIMKGAKTSIDESIKYAFRDLWREELAIIAEREAEKLLDEVKEQL